MQSSRAAVPPSPGRSCGSSGGQGAIRTTTGIYLSDPPNRRYLGNLLDDAKNWLNKVDPNHIVLNSLLLTLKEHKSNTLINSGEEAFIDFMEKLEENEEFSGAAGEIIYFMSNFKSLLKLPDAEKPLHNIIQYLMGTQKTVDDKYFSVPSDKNFIELIFKHHMNTFQLAHSN